MEKCKVNNTSEKYLKDIICYSDLYDRHTVGKCRSLIHFHSQSVKNPPLIGGKKPTKEMMDTMSKMTLELALLFEKGDRYIHKEETIREWMTADEAKDRLYETAQPPAEVRCLKCRSMMNLLDKDFWTGGLNKPDRVLFMFDCPNGCVPRRAFYDNDEEWQSKPNPRPKCRKPIDVDDKITEAKFIAHYKCPSCGFAKTEEIERTANKREEPDPDFVADKAKFCLSKEEGEKYGGGIYHLERVGDLLKKWKEKDDNKELYDKVTKIKKLTVIELEKLLAPALEKENYIHLQLADPEIDRNVIVPFTVQDSKTGRESRASEYDLKKILKKIFKDTNWRLMSEHVSYRPGILSGRLRGYESEEDLIKLVKKYLK